MEKLNLDKSSLRKFGVTMGIAFLVITLLIFSRHRHSILPTAAISAIFFVLAFAVPGSLRQVYILWMKLALVLSWVNTRLILFVIFYLMFTPIGLAMKLFNADPLDRKIDKKKESYWGVREKRAFNHLDYERQF
jgi:hypothetical protein